MNKVEKAILEKILNFIMTHLEADALKAGTPVGNDVAQLLKDITSQLEAALAKLGAPVVAPAAAPVASSSAASK